MSGVGDMQFQFRRRKGVAALTGTLIVTIVLGIVALFILATAVRDQTYTIHFEQSAVLEQATISVVQGIAEHLLKDHGNAFWGSVAIGELHSYDIVVDESYGFQGIAPLKVVCAVERVDSDIWEVRGTGAYLVPENKTANWSAAAKVLTSGTKRIAWSSPGRN